MINEHNVPLGDVMEAYATGIGIPASGVSARYYYSGTLQFLESAYLRSNIGLTGGCREVRHSGIKN
jgi:hypothetical protein